MIATRKKINMIVGILAISTYQASVFAKTRWVIDQVVARVNGANILRSDLDLPRIEKEGGKYSLDEAIMEELFVARSVEQHLLPNGVDVERQVVAFKIQNGMSDMSDSAFEAQLKESGFTLKMYKNQLGRLMSVENVKRAEVSEKTFVSAQDVEEYFHKNPVYSKEEYLLFACTIPEDKISQKGTFLSDPNVEWDDLGWIAKQDLKKDYAFVPNMKKNEISEPVKIDGVYQVLKLADSKDKRLRSLDERYGEIERKLQQEKRETFLKKFEKEMKEKANIVYLK
jgi:parvulin-like peptidyl-prolyl isomerase